MTQGGGTRLRTLRGEMSQKEFAESVGLKQQNYACYESGRYLMKSDLIIKICKTYGCTVEWLLGYGPDESESMRVDHRLNDNLGSRIRRLRRQKLGISADALGQGLSKPRSGPAVRLWELGKTTPDDETLSELAEIFGITVSELLVDQELEDSECGDEELVDELKPMAPSFDETAGEPLKEEGRMVKTAGEEELLAAYCMLSDRERLIVKDVAEALVRAHGE